MTNGKTFFEDLDSDLDKAEISDEPRPVFFNTESQKAVRGDGWDGERHTCKKCGGSGELKIFRRGGGWGQTPETRACFACKGRGWFKTSPEKRAENRQRAAKRKAERKAAEAAAVAKAGQAWLDARPELAAWLLKNQTSFEFAGSLAASVVKFGSLTEKQEAAAMKCIAKEKARAAERAKAESAPAISLIGLVAAFENASGHLKFPKLRLETESGQKVVLSRAGANAKFPGSLNVTDGGPFGDNVWFGRVVHNELQGSRSMTDEVRDLLIELNKDPENAVKVQGQRTGSCCCCGRELTNKTSIEEGIGPICRDRWGW